MSESKWIERLRSRENLERLRNQARPIDIQSLIEANILDRRGAWFEIKDPDRVPEQVWAKVSAVQTSSPGMIQLADHDKVAKAAHALYEQLSGEPFNE